MKIIIFNQPEEQELLVQTVSVKKNKVSPLSMILFRCPYCTYQIIQIQGQISKITPGLEPSDDIPKISLCPRCGNRYTFQDFDYDDEFTNVTLLRDSGNVFYCYICKTPLLRFDLGSIVSLPYMKVVELPTSVICPNYSCGEKYYIGAIID